MIYNEKLQIAYKFIKKKNHRKTTAFPNPLRQITNGGIFFPCNGDINIERVA